MKIADANLIPEGHAVSTSLVGFGTEWWQDGEVIGDHCGTDIAMLVEHAREDVEYQASRARAAAR